MEHDGPIDKMDQYWIDPRRTRDQYGRFRFRIRSDGGKYVVTFKDKRMLGTLEVNRETEFAVDDPESFRELLQRLGCEVLYTKRKRGTKWHSEGMVVEAVTVEGLGCFLEIETLRDSDDEMTLAKARAQLLEVLFRCGLEESDLEPRYYSELLGVDKC
jgi:adenylate cyclase class 2